ncbi:MAG: hemerythrin family protein [Methylomonas sp.]
MDQQHQRLFDLANQRVQSSNLSDHAKQLYLKAREHFQYEEAFMQTYDYAEYQKHADAGDKIDRHNWQQDDALKFMHEWIGHALEVDAAFNDYFQYQAIRQQPDEISISPALTRQQCGKLRS